MLLPQYHSELFALSLIQYGPSLLAETTKRHLVMLDLGHDGEQTGDFKQ